MLTFVGTICTCLLFAWCLLLIFLAHVDSQQIFSCGGSLGEEQCALQSRVSDYQRDASRYASVIYFRNSREHIFLMNIIRNVK